MFGKRRASRVNAARGVAEDAWDQLVNAVENAGGTARSAGRRTHQVADNASSTVATAAGEARRRAAAAMDALVGRRHRTHWEWVAGAVVAGLVVGWFAAAGARKTVDGGDSTDSTGDDRARQLASAETLNSSVSPEY